MQTVCESLHPESKLFVSIPTNLSNKDKKMGCSLATHTCLPIRWPCSEREAYENGDKWETLARLSYNMLQFTDVDFCRKQCVVFVIIPSDTEVMLLAENTIFSDLRLFHFREGMSFQIFLANTN